MFDIIAGPNDLRAPKKYWLLTKEKKDDLCNGAGPKNFGWLIPDTIWGLKITEAANIHDYMYIVGAAVIEDKQTADRVFLNNMIRIIQRKTKWTWLKKLRLMRAKKYYHAVDLCGGPSYWWEKDSKIV